MCEHRPKVDVLGCSFILKCLTLILVIVMIAL
jgi:hypothetical protein